MGTSVGYSTQTLPCQQAIAGALLEEEVWILLSPMNISEVASGNQLRDAYKKVTVKMYRDSNVSEIVVIIFQFLMFCYH